MCIIAAKEYHVLSPYELSTPYVDSNLTESNQLWTELFPRKKTPLFVTLGGSSCLTGFKRIGGGGAVKVDPQWVRDNNIQDTQGYSADGKAIYVVAMYHQLHCVVSHTLKEFDE